MDIIGSETRQFTGGFGCEELNEEEQSILDF